MKYSCEIHRLNGAQQQKETRWTVAKVEQIGLNLTVPITPRSYKSPLIFAILFEKGILILDQQ